MANIMKYLDPMYSVSDTRGISPTRLMEKAIPAESPLHPHRSTLEERTQKKYDASRKKEKEREMEEIRKQIASSSYRPQAMSKGGRTRPVDGCAVKGKTKPPVF